MFTNEDVLDIVDKINSDNYSGILKYLNDPLIVKKAEAFFNKYGNRDISNELFSDIFQVVLSNMSIENVSLLKNLDFLDDIMVKQIISNNYVGTTRLSEDICLDFALQLTSFSDINSLRMDPSIKWSTEALKKLDEAIIIAKKQSELVQNNTSVSLETQEQTETPFVPASPLEYTSDEKFAINTYMGNGSARFARSPRLCNF